MSPIESRVSNDLKVLSIAGLSMYKIRKNQKLHTSLTAEPFGTKVVHLGQRRIGEKRV